MTDTIIQPKVYKNGQSIHLSYGVPHRIYSTAWYPRQSPNGSAIMIYGHEKGVRIIWRGGRRFKSPAPAESQSKTNGSKDASVMIIDSDDEPSDVRSPPFVDKPEFEEDEEELDLDGHPPILQYLDLSFDAAALHITVPPISASATPSEIPFGHGSEILNDEMIFAVACSDHRTRLITLPLTPPSPISKARQDPRSPWAGANAGNRKWGETVLELVGSLLSADGASITISRSRAEGSYVPGFDDSEPTERVVVQHWNRRSEWHVLLASHYREGPGLLLIHVVPIVSVREEGKILHSLSRDCSAPQQKVFMSSPATQITFNPSLSQSNHLLIADRSGACRIYDCGPFNTSDARSPDSTSTGSPTLPGSWLLTLHPGFISSKSDATNSLSAGSSGNFGRKSVVDAKWVVGGKAIIVLLADGEWGIWDIEGTGASGITKAILGRQGIRGGAITAFSISGWIESTPVKSTSSRGPTSQSLSSKFAPMTPGARKTTEPGLFNGRDGHGFTRGQISVSRLPPASATSLVEESIVFWLEDSFYIIPNLRAYWEAQSQRAGAGGSGALFTAGSSTSRLMKLGEVNLLGQRCCGVAQREASAKASLPTEILIICEYHYVIISDMKQEIKGPRRRVVSEIDYQVMAPRDLDVMEIEQFLDQMENRDSPLPQKRRPGFLA